MGILIEEIKGESVQVRVFAPKELRGPKQVSVQVQNRERACMGL